jgi:hypothetical protein
LRGEPAIHRFEFGIVFEALVSRFLSAVAAFAEADFAGVSEALVGAVPIEVVGG